MNNQLYVFDLNAISDFLFKDDDTKTSNSEITEMYVQDDDNDKLVLSNKQLREIKNKGDVTTYSIKYDLLKSFLTILNDINGTVEESTLLQKMTFNSLVLQGIIKTINNE